MKAWTSIVYTTLVTLLCACSPAPPAAVDGDLALIGVVLLDPTSEHPNVPSTVVIRGDRIVAAGPDSELKVGLDVPTIDAAGLYVTPGLWDLHTHLALLGDWAPQLLVTQGVTGVRDLGGDPAVIEDIRHRIASGTLLGPRIVRSGPILNGAPHAPYHRVIETPKAARQAVADLAADGFDLVKTHNATTRDVYFALLEAAHEAGLSVAGHVPVTVTPLEACEAGQASIEHIATLFEGTYLTSFTSQLDAFQAMPAWADEELDTLVSCFYAHQTLFVPTLRAYALRADWAAWWDNPDPNLRYVPAELRKQWRDDSPLTPLDRQDDVIALRRTLVEIGQDLVRRLDAAGAPVGAGTDIAAAGLVPGFDLHTELRLLVTAGLSPQRALGTSTRGPGTDAGGDPLDGRLAAGAPADLVLFRANPFNSLGAFDKIEAVILRGRHLDRATLDGVLRDLEH
jgi:imidazolonepropionase-like amidohydrolase